MRAGNDEAKKKGKNVIVESVNEDKTSKHSDERAQHDGEENLIDVPEKDKSCNVFFKFIDKLCSDHSKFKNDFKFLKTVKTLTDLYQTAPAAEVDSL